MRKILEKISCCLFIFLFSGVLSKPWAIWPLGKLYEGHDISGNKRNLHSAGCEYAEGPEGYPYSANKCYVGALSYLELKREGHCLLDQIQHSFSISVFIVLSSPERKTLIADFRRRIDHYRGVTIIILQITNRRLFLSLGISGCSIVGPKLKLRRWTFVSGSFDYFKKKIRFSVGDYFKEIHNNCHQSHRICTEYLHVSNSQHRFRTYPRPKDIYNTVKFACLHIHNNYLSESEIVHIQNDCLGRGNVAHIL
jgi:hypothetical protein